MYNPHANPDFDGEMAVMSNGRLVKARFPDQEAPNVSWFWIAIGNCNVCKYYQMAPPKCLNKKITDAQFFDEYIFTNTCPEFKAGAADPSRVDTLDVMRAIGRAQGVPSQDVVILVDEPWNMSIALRAHREQSIFLDMAYTKDSGHNDDPERGEYVDMEDDLERPPVPPTEPLEENTALAVDAVGHQHKGKGTGGGQFTSTGGGDGAVNGDNSGNKPTGFPDAAALSKGQRKELKPGVDKVTVGSVSCVVKSRGDSVEGGKREILIHALAEFAGVSTPAVAITALDGRPAAVQQYIEGHTMIDMDPAEKQAAVHKEREQAEKQVVFDYLIGHGDGHQGNFMVSDDGKLFGIDRELVLDNGASDEKFRPELRGLLTVLAGNRDAVSAYRLNTDTVGDMAAAGRKMAAHLSANGKGRSAAQVINRVEVLEKFVKSGGKTVQDLATASNSPPWSFAKMKRSLFGA